MKRCIRCKKNDVQAPARMCPDCQREIYDNFVERLSPEAKRRAKEQES